jgi:hypothetical protein
MGRQPAKVNVSFTMEGSDRQTMARLEGIKTYRVNGNGGAAEAAMAEQFQIS